MNPTSSEEVSGAPHGLSAEVGSMSSTANANNRPLSWFATTLIFVSTSLVGLLIYSFVAFGSVEGAIRYAQGQVITVENVTEPFIATDLTQQPVATFLITNHGNKPVRLLGRNMSCMCMTPDSLPITLAPKSSKLFHIGVRLAGKPRALHLFATIYTDCPEQWKLDFWVDGKIAETQSDHHEEPTAGSSSPAA